MDDNHNGIEGDGLIKVTMDGEERIIGDNGNETSNYSNGHSIDNEKYFSDEKELDPSEVHAMVEERMKNCLPKL